MFTIGVNYSVTNPTPLDAALEKAVNKGRDSGRLDLQLQNLSIIPEQVFALAKLTSINLSVNRLKILPDHMCKLHAVTTLDISCNNLLDLPEAIGEMQALQTLHMRHNNVATLPSAFVQLTGLTDLNVEYNSLVQLPSFSSMAGLARVKLRGNRIEALGGGLGLGAVKILDASGNKIRSVDFAGVSGAVDLNLTFNYLREVGASIVALTRVEKLHLAENEIESVAGEIGRLDKLSELDLRGNRLAALPESICDASALQKLLVCDNALRELPVEIGRLTKLNTLNLTMNQLEALPASVAQLGSLRELQLASNRLAQVPVEVAALTALRSLHLGWNRIPAVDGLLAGLPRLQMIHLNGNAVDEFPAGLCALTGLKELSLGGTKVASIPSEVGAMRGLNALDVALTSVRTLPESLLSAQFMDRLYADEAARAGISDELLARKKLVSTFSPEVARCAGYAVAHSSTRGRRFNMEDSTAVKLDYRGVAGDAYFGVFDGHGGTEAAQLAAEMHPANLAAKLDALGPDGLASEEHVLDAISRSFLSVNSELTVDKIRKSGTTASIALLLKSKLYVAGIGDTRAVLRIDSRALRATLDHKPDMPSEERRIRAMGGFVNRDGRVFGMLAVSRAFGDMQMQPYVSAQPYVDVFDLDGLGLSDIVLACDGVWDMLSDQDACDIVAAHDDLSLAAMCLRDCAYSLGSMDNISVVLVRFAK